MEQLGENFVTTFLLPYIKESILPKIKKDNPNPINALNKLFFTFDPLTREEILGLSSENLLVNTNTIFDRVEYREIFWNFFVDFVKTQKTVLDNDLGQLSKNILPDENNAYTRDAENNLLRFSHDVIQTIEEHEIGKLIEAKVAGGILTKEEAEKLRGMNKEGRLALIRKKEGRLALIRKKEKETPFDYVKEEDIDGALENPEKKEEISDSFFSEFGDYGEVYISFNPYDGVETAGGEKGQTLKQIKTKIQKSKTIHIERDLEKSGFKINAPFKVDEQGVARGEVTDKEGTALTVEVNTEKPGKRMYRVSFKNNPQQKFWINDEDLQKGFKEEKKSAREIYSAKVTKEETEKPLIVPSKGILVESRESPIPEPVGKIELGAGIPGKVPTKSINEPAPRPATAVGAEAQRKEQLEREQKLLGTREKTMDLSGVMNAKSRFAQKKRKMEQAEGRKQKEDEARPREFAEALPAPKPRKKKNPYLIALGSTGVIASGAISTPFIMSLFT